MKVLVNKTGYGSLARKNKQENIESVAFVSDFVFAFNEKAHFHFSLGLKNGKFLNLKNLLMNYKHSIYNYLAVFLLLSFYKKKNSTLYYFIFSNVKRDFWTFHQLLKES